MRSLFIFITLAFVCSSIAVSAERKACYVILQDRDVSIHIGPPSAAGVIARAAEDVCEVGDHLYLEPVYRFSLTYLVTAICDPSYAIIHQPISDEFLSLSCVNSGFKDARQE